MTRHAHNFHVAEQIAAIIHGRDATLAKETSAADTLYVLPLWAWGSTRMSVGRKDLDRDGSSRLEMPVRLEWDVPSVGRLSDLPDGAASFVTRGSGYIESGSVHAGDGPESTLMRSGDAPRSVSWDDGITMSLTPASSFAARTLLDSLKDAGTDSYWALMHIIEEQAKHFVEKAVSSLTLSMSVTKDLPPVLGEHERSELVSEFTLGNAGDTESPAIRLIDRCLLPAAFERVDPQRMMSMSIRRDVKEAARQRIGDPRTGANIRKIAAELGATGIDDRTIEAVVSEFNRRHQSSRVGPRRVRDALSITPGFDLVPLTYEMEDVRPEARSLYEVLI